MTWLGHMTGERQSWDLAHAHLSRPHLRLSAQPKHRVCLAFNKGSADVCRMTE